MELMQAQGQAQAYTKIKKRIFKARILEINSEKFHMD